MTIDNQLKTTMKTLERLIGPEESDRFLSENWGKAHLHVIRNQEDYFADLFTREALDKAIGFSISRDNVFLMKNGNSEPVAQNFEMRSMAEIYEEFSKGAGLLVRQIHLRRRMIGELINTISMEFGYNADADIQAFPPRTRTEKARTASSESFLLQIAGECKWSVTDIDGAQSECLNRPGDTLFLPKGTRTTVETSDDVALCMVINIRAKTFKDLLFRAIADLSDKEVAFRRNLPFGMPIAPDTEGTMKPYIQQHLLPKLEKLDLKAAKSKLSREVKRTMPPLPDGHFTQMNRVDSINTETEVAWRPGMIGEMTFIEGGVIFDFPGFFLQSPEKMFLAIEFLKTHKQFKVGEISGWFNNEERILWVQHLVRKGFLRIV